MNEEPVHKVAAMWGRRTAQGFPRLYLNEEKVAIVTKLLYWGLRAWLWLRILRTVSILLQRYCIEIGRAHV